MSRLIRMAPALVGLALAAPTAAHAGLPPETKAAATPWTPKKVPRTPASPLLQPSQPGVREYAPTIDAGSQGIMEDNHVPPPPGMAADGTCEACKTGVLPVPAGTYVSYRSVNGGRLVATNNNLQRQPAGSDRAPAPPATTIAGREEAPGYAVAGGPQGYAATAPMAAMGEPVPVGVMRTDYRPQGATMPGMPGMPGMAAATTGEGAPGHAVVGGPAAPQSFAGGVGHQGRFPRTFLKHLLRMDDLGHLSAEREARARENHAMMTYGQNSNPTDLSASNVFGR